MTGERAGQPAHEPAGARPGVAWFNAVGLDEARRALLGCCSCPSWAERVAAARPYASVEEALMQADEAVAGLSVSDLEEALSSHPRIGQRSGSGAERRSRREQAGVSGADHATLRELSEGNAAYEERFGHLYLVCATGKSAAEMLSLLRARLANDPDKEWRVVRAELAKINRIRLRVLLGDEP